jgi:hypothetical protein
MTAILVRFKWHGDCPRSGTGPPSYTIYTSPTTDPCNKAADRYCWTVSAFGEHQVAEGRTEELTEARSRAEVALAAYMGAWHELSRDDSGNV